MNKTLEKICGFILFLFVVVVLLLCLTGCSRKTPVEESFDNVQEAMVEFQDTLPAECKTNLVMAKFNELEAKQIVAQNTCETKIHDTEIKYERVLGILILIILAFFAKFFIKK